MEQYYEPSGKFSPLSFVLWIVAALTAFPLLALIYAYAIWYIPIPYLNFFITGAFGFAIGFIVSLFVVKMGKVRSFPLALVFSIFGALTALYFHWAVWVDLAFNISDTIGTDSIGIATSNIKFSEVLAMVLQPSGLFSIMSEINEVGVWGIRGGTVSGGFLTFIWIVEILVTVVVAVLIGTGQAAKPFCEEENEWFQEKALNPMGHFDDGAGLVQALATGDIETLNNVIKPASNVKKEHHAKVTLYDAKSGENYVSISNEMARSDDKGEIKFETMDITSFLKISQEVADRLKS